MLCQNRRRTFEMFAPAWSGRTAEEDPGAPFMNDSPKYVVSSNELGVDWSNSTLLGPYDARKIRVLKDQVDGNIYVSGSGMLVRAMLADGLVDGLHLFVYPVVLGAGEKLFSDDGFEDDVGAHRDRGTRQRRRAPRLRSGRVTRTSCVRRPAGLRRPRR
jgi:dihydrofolate reductase